MKKTPKGNKIGGTKRTVYTVLATGFFLVLSCMIAFPLAAAAGKRTRSNTLPGL